MNTNEIEIKFYAGEKAYAVGKKENWLNLVTDSAGLACLGRIDRCITTDHRGENLRLNEGWSNDEQGYVRDHIIALALSKYPIGADEVHLTAQEIEQAVRTGLEKLAASQKQAAEAEAARKAEAEAKRQADAEKEKSIAGARELLKDELVSLHNEIERLKRLNIEFRERAEANEEAVRQKLAEDGSFEVEEEHTVTYKVVREGEDC